MRAKALEVFSEFERETEPSAAYVGIQGASGQASTVGTCGGGGGSGVGGG